MEQRFAKLTLLILLCTLSLPGLAQHIKGILTDANTHEPLVGASVYYKHKKDIGSSTDLEGRFALPYLRRGGKLVVSAIGYRTEEVALPHHPTDLHLALHPEEVLLDEVVVKPQKNKYRKKNNPAVELMEKVIGRKEACKLANAPYYTVEKYDKMKLSLNNLKPEDLEQGLFKRFPFLKEQVEVSSLTHKLILPISLREVVSENRHQPTAHRYKKVIQAERSKGLEDFFTTGDVVEKVLQEFFTGIDLYDDEIKLLNQRFVSPISRHATSFYQFYIADTLQQEGKAYIHLNFVPQNVQDFGFTGELFIDPSTYTLRRCSLRLPHRTAVNFVHQMQVVQTYQTLPNGLEGLETDHMLAEMAWSSPEKESGFQIERLSHHRRYDFASLPPEAFQDERLVTKTDEAETRTESYWQAARAVPLSEKEEQVSHLLYNLKQTPRFKTFLFAAKTLIENHIELGATEERSGYFDLGPINSSVSSNYLDGLRLRLGGSTTARLHPHLFFRGFAAYGFKDRRWKYQATLSYSFRPRRYALWEFPRHYLSATYSYDVASPFDKFLLTDKDNLFTSIKTTRVDQLSYIRQLSLQYEWEASNGWGVQASLKRLEDTPAGRLIYQPIDLHRAPLQQITTLEAGLRLRYAPGEEYINTKKGRKDISKDSPVFMLYHAIGIPGILGSDYRYHRTEASIWNRFWLPASWGKVETTFKAGAQWSVVPFPYLILPEANLSFFAQKETFSLMSNMEFMNDRFASTSLTYYMNGKFFNRIPLIKRLKWREVFKLKALWGTLTEKNDPSRSNDSRLLLFPTRNGQPTTFVMDPRTPYVEGSVGIYNIFKLLHVEYVYRFTYRHLPHANKHGVRFMVQFTF